jgi:hypothetical protein
MPSPGPGRPTGQPPRRVRPGRLERYAYWRAAAVALNWTRSVLRNQASLSAGRKSAVSRRVVARPGCRVPFSGKVLWHARRFLWTV